MSEPAIDPCPALTALDADRANTARAAAAEYLYRWTGGAFGLCEITIRPCRSDCHDGRSTYRGTWAPALVNGDWSSVSCGSCGDLCGCGDSGASSLRLPGPVYAVTAVVIDGELLDPSNYRVDNKQLLVREDGEGWPTCQDLSLPEGEVGTFTISYQLGNPVPPGGQLAAETLACELAKAISGDGTCQLPQRVQSITRQGVTIAMLDSFDDVDKGHTGIWIIDSWIASIRNIPRSFSVRSVDVAHPKPRKTTWRSS